MRSNSDHLLRENWNIPFPVIINGKGIYLHDSDGNQYIDGVGGVHVVSIGYGVNEIAEAVYEQIKKIPFVNRRQFLNEPAIELAGKVISLSPKTMEKVYFVSGGSEANEMALQIAYQYHLKNGHPQKYRLIGRWHSYHGFTVATESMGGHLIHRRKLNPYLLDFPHIQPPFCYHCPFNLEYPSCSLACAQELERVIIQENPDTISAFIAEPIIGSTGGAIVPPPGYYETIKEICEKYDVLFIADEVITGFGRTGTNFGIDHWDTQPDIITCAKGLSSGYSPIGAVIIGTKVWEILSNNIQGSLALRLTFSGNPVSCAAALAVQNYLEKHDLIRRCSQIGSYLINQLKNLCKSYECIGDVRGRGLFVGVEFVSDLITKTPFPRNFGFQERLVKEAYNQKLIILGGSGTGTSLEGDHILLSPPFTINEVECDVIVNILSTGIKTVYDDYLNWKQ